MSEFVLLVVGVGLVVAKTVDFIRNAFDKNTTAPKWVWNLAALAIGVAYCVGWQINYGPAFAAAVPALHDSAALAGWLGTVGTGLVAGASAGFLHETMDALSGIAKRNRTRI